MISLIKALFYNCLLLVSTVSMFSIERHPKGTRHVDSINTTHKKPPENHPQLNKVISQFLSVHKRSTRSDVFEFSMRSDIHNRVDWERVNRTLAFESEESMKALGSKNGEIPGCPASVFTGAHDPVEKRSTCPWFYKVNHEPGRFPNSILMAHPACMTCIGSGGNYVCAPVTRSITVLMKSASLDSNGNSIWVEDETKIMVGYTCSGRKFLESSAPSAFPDSMPGTT